MVMKTNTSEENPQPHPRREGEINLQEVETSPEERTARTEQETPIVEVPSHPKGSLRAKEEAGTEILTPLSLPGVETEI